MKKTRSPSAATPAFLSCSTYSNTRRTPEHEHLPAPLEQEHDELNTLHLLQPIKKKKKIPVTPSLRKPVS
jgi:hypothetical protein